MQEAWIIREKTLLYILSNSGYVDVQNPVEPRILLTARTVFGIIIFVMAVILSSFKDNPQENRTNPSNFILIYAELHFDLFTFMLPVLIPFKPLLYVLHGQEVYLRTLCSHPCMVAQIHAYKEPVTETLKNAR